MLDGTWAAKQILIDCSVPEDTLSYVSINYVYSRGI